jgi:hypothetical protein
VYLSVFYSHARNGFANCTCILNTKGYAQSCGAVWLCADVEARDAGQRTPLLLAAKEGHHTVVRCLLAAPADVNAVDERKVRQTTGGSSLRQQSG